MDERVAVPVVQGGRPHAFLDQPPMFALNENVISDREAYAIKMAMEISAQRKAEKAMIEAQVAQEAASHQALMSPQAQAMVNAQYGAG